MSVDFGREVKRLAAELRERDADPRCAAWPVEDAYARISHVNTGSDADKPVVQLYFTLRAMLTRDVRLGDTFTDTNRSAWKEDGVRPGWDAVMERLVAGTSHGVASVMIDRMMRQAWTLEDLVRQHKRAHGRARGFTLYDVDSAKLYRTNNVDDLDALRGKVQKSEYDSAVKSARILRANEARRLVGNGRNGRAPFGHRWSPADISDEQLAAERAAVRWGIHHVTDGGSWGEVAVRWTADGVRPRSGGRWHNGNVRSCLYGPGSAPTVGLRHAGLLHTGGRVVGTVVDADGPVVTLAEWHAFEATVGGRSRGRQRGDVESRYYASGTLICGGTRDTGEPCGTPLVGTAQPGRYADDGEGRYGYKCPPRGCRGVTVDGRAAEMWTSLETAKAIVDGDNIALLAHVGHDDRLAELDRLVADAERAVENAERQHDVARTPERRQRAADRVVEFERRLNELIVERDELAEMERQARLKPSDVDELCALWNNPDTPSAKRRTIMRQCLPGGVYVRPVGRGARLRGEQIFTRFYKGGDA